MLGEKILKLKGNVYSLPQEPGLPLLFGVEVEGVEPLVSSVKLFLEGHVSSVPEAAIAGRVPSGDFHEWFEINNIPSEVAVKVGPLPVANAPLATLTSKLFFNGQAGKEGKENFLTLPSVCGPRTLSTSYVELESKTGEKGSAPTVPPVGITGCGNVPFKPTAVVKPESSIHDGPDGAETIVKVPQQEHSSEINTSAIADAHVTLPEGLTLNPSAGHGLEACTPAQVAFGSAATPSCPAGSKLGTVTIETDLPPNSLTGSLYLAAPKGLPIGEPPVHRLPRGPERLQRHRQAGRQGRSQPRHRQARSELPEKPSASLQRTAAEAQRRPLRAAGQPTWLRPGLDELVVPSLLQHDQLRELQPLRDHRMPRLAAVRTHAEHDRQFEQGWRVHLTSPSTPPGRKASSTCPRSTPRCLPASSA